MRIPLSQPYWGSEEVKYSTKAIKTTIGTGDGLYTRQAEALLGAYTNAQHVLSVTSCTHGLEMAIRAFGVKEGDEVILPSFTMSSTANAVVLAGGIPVFADIEDSRYTLDPADVSWCITPRTKGIILMHYAGMSCLMEPLLALAKKHHLFVLEDAAHAIGSFYKNRALGTFGDIGVYSFHGTKNICCGEGGAVVTDNDDLARAMEIYRANGTNRKEFLQGAVDKYTWVGAGTSFFLSDILASLLVPQMKKVQKITAMRGQIANAYMHAFTRFQDIVALPVVPDHTVPNWHIFALRFRKEEHARTFVRAMRAKGIEASYHYVPLHASPMGMRLQKNQSRRNGKIRPLPVTESVAKTLVRLPIYPGLTGQELHYIIEEATRIFRKL